MKILNFLVFALCSSQITSQYIVDDTLMIHYDKLYYNNNRFSNALNDNYIIDINTNNTDDCMKTCAINELCLGIYENYDNDYYCNTLSNLGSPTYANEDSNSYVKIMHHNSPLTNHSLNGIIWDSSLFNNNNDNYTIKIYLDINHNGVLDNGEPTTFVSNDRRFTFDNITSGTYLVRQITPDTCVQLYPGLNGSFMIGDNNIQGDGFIDNVIRFRHHGGNNYSHPIGGYIHNDTIFRDDNFTFIIGNNTDTYMGFHPNDSIVMVFIDETILNKDGDDLYINMINNSNTYANISVSHDEQTYEYLGIINSSNVNRISFDLSSINYELPVNYIKLDFFGENMYEPLNIINLGIYNHSIYLPPFAYNINVPKFDTLLFLNDCHYDFSCGIFCDFNIFDDNNYESCIYGCNVFDNTHNCDCSSVKNDNEDFILNTDFCMTGCEYSIDKYVYPNYTLFMDNNGISESKISDFENCTNDCLDVLLSNCNVINNCRSLSLSNNDISANIFNNYKHRHSNNTLFLLKNSYFNTTSTTTTTSATTTSTTATTTTTSATSSTTTSATSSTTTSATSSTTTSATSSTTTSATSSTTTSATSSTTTSETSLINTNVEIVNKNKNITNNIIIGVATTGGVLLIILVVLLLMNKFNNKNLIENRAHFSATNPVYDTDNIEQPELYQDIDTNHKSLYQDVNHDSDATNGYIHIMDSES